MRPPLAPGARDISDLQILDAQALAPAGANGTPLLSNLSGLRLDVAQRHSKFTNRPVSITDAWGVVGPVVTARTAQRGPDGYLEQRTLVPSAGARHPFTALLIHREPGDTHHCAWAVSPSVSPTYFEVPNRTDQVNSVLRATTHALRVAETPATVIVVLGRFRRTLSKYPDGHSLVWRDAGAFLAMLQLVAISRGLHACIAGITETTPFPLRDLTDELVDVGAVVLSKENR